MAHSGTGQLYTVDPASGASAAIKGVIVPGVDGIVLDGQRLWAVLNTSDQVSRIRLQPDLSSGVVEEVFRSNWFQRPSTAARFGSRLAVVNAKYQNSGSATADHFEVVVIKG